MKALINILLLLAASATFMPMTSYAEIEVYEFKSDQQEAQYRGLIEEFRCPKCQNQNLAGSDAPIAQDLKQKTYDMIQDGRTDAEIRQFMQERYGDFISYKPPVRPSTWVLWFFPPLLLILILGGWFWRTQRRRHRSNTVVDTSKGRGQLSPEEQATLDRLLASRTASKTPAEQQLAAEQKTPLNHTTAIGQDDPSSQEKGASS